MKAIVRRLGRKGDTVAVFEDEVAIRGVVVKVLRSTGLFLAVEGEVVHDAGVAMEKVAAVHEAEIIVGRQVAGG